MTRQANDELRQKLRELAMVRRRFGYRRLHALLRRDGLAVNHKRVYRLYVEEQLWVRKRGRKRRVAVPRVPMLVPERVNQVWSMDFVSDALASGRRFRTLNIADDFSREAPAIEVDTSLGGVRVTRVLDRLKIERGLPFRSARIMARSLLARRWSSGLMRTAWSGTLSSRASRSRTPTLKALTRTSETSVSTTTGSPPWPTPGRRSKNGGRITINGVRTAHLATGRPRSSHRQPQIRAMEKTAIHPPWKTLRVSTFPQLRRRLR